MKPRTNVERSDLHAVRYGNSNEMPLVTGHEMTAPSSPLGRPTTTYGGGDRTTGDLTQGGFAGEYVARERFVHRLPDGLDSAGTAPLLCAGVTV